MSEYSRFFLNSKSSVALVELIELSHPSFSQTHRVVRNVTAGVTVQHVVGGPNFIYTYYPLQIKPKGSADDLDFGIEVEFGDLEGRLQAEIALLREADTLRTKPICTLRNYRSDDYTHPIYGPLVLEISELSFSNDGASFDAIARYQNQSSSGELYDLTRFPMLRDTL